MSAVAAGQPDSVRLLGQGEVTGIGIAAAQKQHRGQHLQLRLHPSAKCGPPLVTYLPKVFWITIHSRVRV